MPAERSTSRAPVGLDADAVVGAALELVDERGPAAFTVRALAERLGVQAPTIYWHVGAKAQLFERIVERVVLDMAVATAGPWDERLQTFLDTARQHLLAHPGAVELLGVVHSRAFAVWGSEAVDIMRAAGFDEPAAVEYARTALFHANSAARAEAARMRAAYYEPVPGAVRRYRIRPEVLPERLGSDLAALTSYDPDRQHELATAVFVDGIRAAVGRLPRG